MKTLVEFHVKGTETLDKVSEIFRENLADVFSDGLVWLYDGLSKKEIKTKLKTFGLVAIW
jgi:hypothetical protein